MVTFHVGDYVKVKEEACDTKLQKETCLNKIGKIIDVDEAGAFVAYKDYIYGFPFSSLILVTPSTERVFDNAALDAAIAEIKAHEEAQRHWEIQERLKKVKCPCCWRSLTIESAEDLPEDICLMIER